LIFSLVTHRGLFNPAHDDASGEFAWPVKRSIGVLAGASLVVGVMSEILVGSIEEASHAIGLSEFFVGVFIIAIVGNAAEHWVAVLVAYKNKMDLAVNIAIGSAAQVALFVAPVLVLLSFFVGPHPMPLVFNGFELAGLLIAIVTANLITSDGESTWFEGLQLLSLYAVIGTAFFFA
jgi:Ca2+:H+ antiporter